MVKTSKSSPVVEPDPEPLKTKPDEPVNGLNLAEGAVIDTLADKTLGNLYSDVPKPLAGV